MFHAENGDTKTGKLETGQAGNLHSRLPLAIEAHAIFTQNYWIERGVVNSSVGTVYDILWSIDQDMEYPRAMRPSAISVKFDCYIGPCAEGTLITPIFPVERKFTNSNHDRFQVSSLYHSYNTCGT